MHSHKSVCVHKKIDECRWNRSGGHINCAPTSGKVDLRPLGPVCMLRDGCVDGRIVVSDGDIGWAELCGC